MGDIQGLNLSHFCNNNYSLDSLIQYNQIFSITSTVSFFFTSVILVLVFFYKAYRTILQRLMLYLTLFVMLHQTIISFNFQLQPSVFSYTGNSVCKWTGYSSASVYICTLLISFEISVYLLYMMYHQIQNRPTPVLKKMQRVMLELTSLFIAMVVPPSLLALPNRYFGVSGAACWVTAYKNSSCITEPGAEKLEITLFLVYTFIITVNLIAYGVLVVIFWSLSRRFKESKTQYRKTAKRTIILFCLLVLTTATHLISLLLPYFIRKMPNISFHGGFIALCIISPATESLRPLAYMYYLNSVKKFRWRDTKITAGEWKVYGSACCMRAVRWLRGNRERVMINNMEGDSTEYITPSLFTTSFYGSLQNKPEE